MLIWSRMGLQYLVAALVGADPHGIVHWQHEDLAVAVLAGPCAAQNCVDDLVHILVAHYHLDLHLGRHVDSVVCAAVGLKVAALAAETPHVGHCYSSNADLAE